MAKEKHIFPVVGAMCFKWHPSVQEGFAFVDLSGYSILKRVSVALRSIAQYHFLSLSQRYIQHHHQNKAECRPDGTDVGMFLLFGSRLHTHRLSEIDDGSIEPVSYDYQRDEGPDDFPK